MILAEALVAIVCHDLSSPLGTVINALELAAEDPSSAAEALLLAREAAEQTVRRLELLRAAWAGSSSALSRDGLAELAAGLPHRVTVIMDALAGRSFDGRISRMLLQAMLVAASALPRGGTVVLAGDGTSHITAQPVGAYAAWPPRLVALLTEPATSEPRPALYDSPADALAPVLALLAGDAGYRASWLPSAAVAPLACPVLMLARLT